MLVSISWTLGQLQLVLCFCAGLCMQQFRKKKKRREKTHGLLFSSVWDVHVCIGIVLPPHVVPIRTVTCILPILLSTCWNGLIGSTTAASVSACLSFWEANACHPWQMSMLWIKLLPVNVIPEASFSHSFFSASLKKKKTHHTEMFFPASPVIDVFLLTGRLRACQF